MFFFFCFFFVTAGVLISVAPVLHDILPGSLIKRLRKPAYTEALNSANYKPPSAFATIGELQPNAEGLAAGFSPDAAVFHHLFLMRRVGGTRME